MSAGQGIQPEFSGTELTQAAKAAPALRVLLVDDDEINLMILNQQFLEPHVEVDTANNGQLALQSVMSHRPDIIVMDIEMPVMDGIEALQQIRSWQMRTGQAASLIASFSGNNDVQSQARYRALGFDKCLSKPVQPEDVAHLLQCVDRPRSA